MGVIYRDDCMLYISPVFLLKTGDIDNTVGVDLAFICFFPVQDVKSIGDKYLDLINHPKL